MHTIAIKVPQRQGPPYSLILESAANRSINSSFSEIKTTDDLLGLINEVRPFSEAEEREILEKIRDSAYEEGCAVDDATYGRIFGLDD
jgi:hypothetical protein